MTRSRQIFCFRDAFSKSLRSAFRFVTCILLSCFVMLVYSSLYAADTDVKLCTLQFNQVTFSDVLEQLTAVSGIRMIAEKFPENERFTGSYVERPVEQIMRDVLRRVSHALVYHYGEKGLESIDIWIFEQGGGEAPKNLASLGNTDRFSGYHSERDRNLYEYVGQEDYGYYDEDLDMVESANFQRELLSADLATHQDEFSEDSNDVQDIYRDVDEDSASFLIEPNEQSTTEHSQFVDQLSEDYEDKDLEFQSLLLEEESPDPQLPEAIFEQEAGAPNVNK